MKNTIDPPRKKKQKSKKNIKESIDRHFDNPADEENKDISKKQMIRQRDDSSEIDEKIYDA